MGTVFSSFDGNEKENGQPSSSPAFDILEACVVERNPFVRQLTSALKSMEGVARVKEGRKPFWNGPEQTKGVTTQPVLHFHWPEALFDNWRTPDETDLDRFRTILQAWRDHGALLVGTIHNVVPHGQNVPIYDKLYRMLYRRVDGVIHMGEISRERIEERYGNEVSDAYHTVIPHGNYRCMPNEVGQGAAREKIDVSSDAAVVLVFGSVRRINELRVTLRGFWRLRNRPKRLIIHRVECSVSRTSLDYLRYWLPMRFDPRIQVLQRFIPDEKVQIYLNAADVLLIPRTQGLNSGNVALGFTFGRVTVGPSFGVMGEVLEKTGNPTYDRVESGALVEALRSAFRLVGEGHGERNAEYAREHMRWDTLAEKHVRFFRKVGSSIRN